MTNNVYKALQDFLQLHKHIIQLLCLQRVVVIF